jgi:hypothetical protein
MCAPSTTYLTNNINQHGSVSGCSISNGPEREVSDFQGSDNPQPSPLKAWARGKHDGYPSSVIFGAGQRMYEWHQQVRAGLRAPMEQHFTTDAVKW